MTAFEQLLEELRALPKRERQAAALLEDERFQRAVELIGEREGVESLIEIAMAGDAVRAALALEALAGRESDPTVAARLKPLLRTTRTQRAVFLLRALDRHAPNVLTDVLAAAGAPWRGDPLDALKALTWRRRDEPIDFGAVADDSVGAALKLVRALGTLPLPVEDELRARAEGAELADSLRPIGRVRRSAEAVEAARAILRDAALDAEIDALVRALRADKPVLIVGERGSGRMSRARAAAGVLAGDGWTTFEAGAPDVNAGMIYVGELDGRVRFLIDTLGGKRALWIVPEFELLLGAGVYRGNPRGGILDLLLAGIGDAKLHLAGLLDPAGYDRLARARPAIRDVFDVVRVEPMDEPRSLALAARAEAKTGREVLREALALGRHFLGDGALPGSLLSLLEAARRRRGDAQPLTAPDVLATISERSGLPLSLLDERERLDIAKLRAFFAGRVIGQPEAVECMVERVALLKAGLTDPTRPQAVLLFVGPTGTGKTELAKALAEYLFGSPDRMIRLDMSEYQSPGSARRMLGDGEVEDASLVARIRRQPFSVVLLDEFEKADPSVWDLFLQVFDDGRLSDPRGEAADFRHAVIIMTSNLGARIAGGMGFSPASGFAAGTVEQAVTRAFRPEFLNRLDRTVVFRPLSRPVMREILSGEIESVLARRGLRGRQWAVEFDDSALEFLLSEGFTPDLGARPLKRAVERHFLTPLALTIAGHEYPSGDQFLFVSARGASLGVEWVNPDEPAPAAPAAEASLRTLAREGAGALTTLDEAYDAVRERVADAAWQAEKADLLARLGEPGFWEDEGRVAVLSGVELRDRIEAGTRAAGSLLRRLRNARRPPADLVRRAAQRVLLLEQALDALAAGEPADAELKVDGDPEFGPRVAAMYKAWARERGMRLEEGAAQAGRKFRWSATVTGFAALRTLRPEAGLHVLEVPDGRGGIDRRRVRVTVTPEEPDPPSRTRIVRRYRERPAPLVRDAVRGWRTGRLEAVLAGGFDLVE